MRMKQYPFSRSGLMVRSCGFLLLVIFIMTFHILPSAYPITVEEQAGRRESKSQAVESDEFSRKVPERRDTSARPQERDPRLACLMSLIIPGGGHIYLREDLKGVGFCLLTGAAYGASGFYLYQAFTGDYSGAEKKSKMVIAGLFLVVGVIVHVVGIVEAYNDAIEINERSFYYGTSHSRSPYIADLTIE